MSFMCVEHAPDILDQRAGFRLQAEWGHVSAVTGGGHICEFVRRTHPAMNPLWRPPWHTVDPERYRPEHDENTFGGPPDGRLLAGIAGHSICFDYFGPPSVEETGRGFGTHGEAPAIRWSIFLEFNNGWPGVEYGAELPAARIDLRRTLRIDPKHPVVYCEERARNLSDAARPISWNEHVTIGPPFLECGTTLVDMPATRGKVMPEGGSDAMLLQPDADFCWPDAPLLRGGTHDLRTTPDGSYSRHTAQLLDQTRQIGYVAISNPSAGLLLAYVFRREDFPWVGNWEERFCRKTAPWNGRTFCRGLEFSTTPFPLPKEQMIAQGPLFQASTYRWLPADAEITVRYMTLLAEISPDYQGVSEVLLEEGRITLQERGAGRSISVPAQDCFLRREAINP